MAFFTNAGERMRIASTGRVTIGGTSTSGDTLFNLYSVSHSQNAMAHVNSSDTGTIHNLRCINASGTLVGGITNDGSNTTFATSSDYRLKENVDYTWDATTRLKQLKPARFNWIADDTNTLMDGFIAHEVSSIVPEAVRGAKDATRTEIDEDGDEQTFIEPQGIDQSKLVPLMVKTIQELEARIKTLEDA